MVADREAHLLVDVGLDELRRPVPVIGANESARGDVVQQAREDDLLARAVLLREARTLQHVGGRAEPILEEVEEGRLVGHARQARVMPHQIKLALVVRRGQGVARVTLPRRVDGGLDDDESVQLFDLRVVGGLGLR